MLTDKPDVTVVDKTLCRLDAGSDINAVASDIRLRALPTYEDCVVTQTTRWHRSAAIDALFAAAAAPAGNRRQIAHLTRARERRCR